MSGMTTKHGKRVYQKPTIEQVRLNAEEAVLQACKSVSLGIVGWGGDCENFFVCQTSGS